MLYVMSFCSICSGSCSKLRSSPLVLYRTTSFCLLAFLANLCSLGHIVALSKLVILFFFYDLAIDVHCTCSLKEKVIKKIRDNCIIIAAI